MFLSQIENISMPQTTWINIFSFEFMHDQMIHLHLVIRCITLKLVDKNNIVTNIWGEVNVRDCVALYDLLSGVCRPGGAHHCSWVLVKVIDGSCEVHGDINSMDKSYSIYHVYSNNLYMTILKLILWCCIPWNL